MQNISKAKLSILFLTLSMFMGTSQIKTERLSIKELITNNKEKLLYLAPILLAIIPMYQLYSKSPKKAIPSEEEYSWQDIKESLTSIINDLAGKLHIKKSKFSREEVKRAWLSLCKNISNLYHMGFVGQISRDPVLKTDGKVLKWTESTPARGFLGHFIDQYSDLKKASKEVMALIEAIILIEILYHGNLDAIKTRLKLSGTDSK